MTSRFSSSVENGEERLLLGADLPSEGPDLMAVPDPLGSIKDAVSMDKVTLSEMRPLGSAKEAVHMELDPLHKIPTVGPVKYAMLEKDDAQPRILEREPVRSAENTRKILQPEASNQEFADQGSPAQSRKGSELTHTEKEPQEWEAKDGSGESETTGKKNLLDWSDTELLDVSNFGEIVEVDEGRDPPVEAPTLRLESCSFESRSKLPVREHVPRSEEALRSGVREILAEMEKAPKTFSPAVVAEDEDFLQQVNEHILDAEKICRRKFPTESGGMGRIARRIVPPVVKEGPQVD